MKTKPALTLSWLPDQDWTPGWWWRTKPVDLVARVRMAAQPLSLMTSETSGAGGLYVYGLAGD